MLSTVFNPCSDVLSGFLWDWNERGWIVNIKVTLKVTTRFFFLFIFEEITDVFFVFNSMVQSISCTP